MSWLDDLPTNPAEDLRNFQAKLAQLVRRARLRCLLTQPEMAKLLGVPVGTIGSVESRGIVGDELLDKFIDFLRVRQRVYLQYLREFGPEGMRADTATEERENGTQETEPQNG